MEGGRRQKGIMGGARRVVVQRRLIRIVRGAIGMGEVVVVQMGEGLCGMMMIGTEKDGDMTRSMIGGRGSAKGRDRMRTMNCGTVEDHLLRHVLTVQVQGLPTETLLVTVVVAILAVANPKDPTTSLEVATTDTRTGDNTTTKTRLTDAIESLHLAEASRVGLTDLIEIEMTVKSAIVIVRIADMTRDGVAMTDIDTAMVHGDDACSFMLCSFANQSGIGSTSSKLFRSMCLNAWEETR